MKCGVELPFYLVPDDLCPRCKGEVRDGIISRDEHIKTRTGVREVNMNNKPTVKQINYSRILAEEFLAYLQGIETVNNEKFAFMYLWFLAYLQGIETKLPLLAGPPGPRF